ncbi:hypothetical protein D9O50_02605 [Oxalobacteraceae bacterium CAVE-383]|nr:hypothetical protein D9O50_02605 [Oxalobacteraceae bacterium CAVE-383]
MISQSAREGFNHLLTRALRTSFVSDEQSCDIDVIADLHGIPASTTVVLTISSYLFRLIVMVHFASDQATREHVARVNKIAAEAMSDQSFHDAVAECGNICCGILNRDLGPVFPHIGMSTPNLIDTRCTGYLDMLDSGHMQHFEVKVDGVPMFHVSLCVCDYADLDFAIDINDAGADTGELELF